MSLDEDEFDEFDDEYLAELDNLNKKFTDCEDDIGLEDYLIEDVGGSRNDHNDDYSGALVPAEEEEDIDSEEEKDILKGIRDEIENKVRDEMKDELQMYKSQLLALEAGKPGNVEKDKPDAEAEAKEEEEEMDPKLKEALAKMRKLDRILMKKIRREKEVKRDRMIMERRLREEVSQMKHGATYYSEIKVNTDKFLALAAPLSHNAGISLQDIDSDLPPLFQTEIDSEMTKSGKQTSHENRNHGNSSRQNNPEQSSTASQCSRDGSRASKSGNKERNANSKKDFIQRNKELAAASNEVIAMTDDEKKRLHDLLEDVDDMPELEEGLDETSSVSFHLSLNTGDGFQPDDNELKSLTNIDSRLKNVMADDDYKSVVGSSVQSTPRVSSSSTPRQPLFTRVGVRTDASLLDGLGERVLYETKEERELNARLQAIEKELEIFKAPQEMETDRTDFHLTDEQLDKLLDQCARSASQMSVMQTPDSSARSNLSSRQALMANPPKLSDEQLQQLLSEAHFPMSSHLLALREDDEKLMDGDGRTEIIRAETWKTIIDENLDSHSIAEADSLTPNPDTPAFTPHYTMSDKNDNHGDLSEEEDGANNVNAFSDYNHRKQLRQRNDEGDIHSFSSSHNNSANKTCLPKINSSNSIPRQSSQSESTRSGCPSPTNIREISNVSNDSVRLPKISSNSFLIHASQGLNNEAGSTASPALARRPFKMVHNDLSEMRLDSFSEDESNVTDRRNDGVNSPAIPRPPSGSKPKDIGRKE